MPREKDSFRDHVKFLPNNKWKCNFCSKEYGGSVTRIKAHLAGVAGYGINDCKDVDGRVRSEARNALKGKGAAEPSNGAEGNVEEGPHLPVTANNEDARREPSFAAMPDLRSDVISTVGVSSSAFLPLLETNLPSQSLPAQNMIPWGEFPFSPQQPQFHAGDSSSQPWNFSYPSSRPDLAPEPLTNMPRPVNAEEGEPNTEVPQGASSSAFLPLPDTNLPSQSLLAQSMIPLRDCSFWPQPPQSQAGDSSIQPWNFSYPSSRPDLAPEALTNMPSPVNAEEGEPNTEVPQDDALGGSHPNICGLVNKNMPILKRKLEELSSREADMDELETWCRKANRIKAEYWSMVQPFREGKSLSPPQVARVDDLSKEVEEILGHGSFRKGTIQAAGCKKSSPLLTTKLVGDEREDKIEEICDYLMEDEIFIIGIYGMGGVGKTTILMHVHNRVLFENPAFNDVFWITVPQEFSVYELQDEIANAVGLDNLSKYKDVKWRACILDKHLRKKRAVLVLDGLWMHFEVEDVGIPVEKGGLKLVLTTRSLDVCHKMLCQKQIKIELLDPYDSWSLFLEKLCFGRKLPPEIKGIARSIVDKCEGLPVGIIEIATRMRGLKEVHEWKGMLRKLEGSMAELDVFKRLKLSYMNLGDPQVQECFLHLMLCLKSQQFPTEIELIESFIDEGLLHGIGARQELHDQGNTILNKLRKDCLWDDTEFEYSRLHPLIRDMVLHLVRDTTHMVKANMGLKEIPKEKFWTNRLEKVVLQDNEIEEISYSISPNCPKLTRLSLNDNLKLGVIPESFFRHLNSLEVLDLSYTRITELPHPICHLESLEALLLRGCWSLRHIPCVRKLRSLRKLDLQFCRGLEEVPEGMEMLVKLTYLNLVGTMIQTLTEGVLPNLVNLQYLAIQGLRAREEIKLKKVEALYCCIPNVETFNACVRFLDQNGSRQYHLALNASVRYFFRDRSTIIKNCHGIAARVDGEIGWHSYAQIPENVRELEVERCSGMTSLSEVGPLEDLEKLTIKEWEKLEELGAVHFPHLWELNIAGCSKLKDLLEEGQGLPCLLSLDIEGSEELEEIKLAAPSLDHMEVSKCPKMKRAVESEWLATLLPNLKSIKIKNCEKLEEIISGPLPSGAPCVLNSLSIEGCNGMKWVLTQDMLLHVPFLRVITVDDCKGMKVIIGTVPNMTHSSFPNLTSLVLWDLPELESICDGTMSCDSIELIDVKGCPHLKSIPLQLPLLDNGLPSPPPSLWAIKIDNRQTWESLEWGHPLAPSSLERLLRFYA
ncbi:probable disease resistance protein At1g61300 isoform X4 [Syzygium oleosum]|uniref:probable disease resistance protein At1g61300 isoform X4 n=1 Tax=Syzygium oleosum TaxID=219896 RepID=UPI0024BA5C37|nr:probable disease resistance protein At1g61300 isoform X4 [Syzygium oleosum]